MLIKYTIFTHIPYSYRYGEYFTDVLWYWDLKAIIQALNNIAKVSVVAPLSPLHMIRNPTSFKNEELSILGFQPLPSFSNYHEFLSVIPQILSRLNKYVSGSDVVHCGATLYPFIGIIALIFSFFKNKKSIFVIDADAIRDLEIKLIIEQKTTKRMMLILLKMSASLLLNFCILISNITLVVGNAIYKRYGHWKKIRKIYASWIKEVDIISILELRERRIERSKKDTFKIIYASSLSFKKGILTAIRAMEMIKKKRIPVTLTILGSGPLEKNILQIIKKNNLYNCVKLAGYIPYGPLFYNTLREYDVILIPNLSGEQPRILFDALANGVAIIASNIDAFNDILSNENNGMLFTMDNSTELALLIEKLFNDRQLLNKLIENGVETARKFTQENTYEYRMKIIEGTLSTCARL